MRYLSLGEIVDLHQSLLDQSGGSAGIRERPWREGGRPARAALKGRATHLSKSLQEKCFRWCRRRGSNPHDL